jgi:hypothetical protein
MHVSTEQYGICTEYYSVIDDRIVSIYIYTYIVKSFLTWQLYRHTNPDHRWCYEIPSYALDQSFHLCFSLFMDDGLDFLFDMFWAPIYTVHLLSLIHLRLCSDRDCSARLPWCPLFGAETTKGAASFLFFPFCSMDPVIAPFPYPELPPPAGLASSPPVLPGRFPTGVSQAASPPAA